MYVACMYICLCLYISMVGCMCIRMYVLYVCTYVRMHVCMYVCMYVYGGIAKEIGSPNMKI